MNSIFKTRFGALTITPEKQISFSEGLVGLRNLTQFAVLDPHDTTYIVWLQSLQYEGLAFGLLEPRFFIADYSFTLDEKDAQILETNNLEACAVFCILTIPEQVKDMTANMKAPIVINPNSRKGVQLILNNNTYPIKYPIFNDLQNFKSHMSSVAKTQKKEFTLSL